MTRAWYTAPFRIHPGTHVPGRWVGSEFYGLSSQEMGVLRGPVDSCENAVGTASRWREGGRRSALWLVLVEDGQCTHCTKFDDEREREPSA